MSQGYFTSDGNLVGHADRQGYCGRPESHLAHVAARLETAGGPMSMTKYVACSGDRWRRLISASERHGFGVPETDQVTFSSETVPGLWRRFLTVISKRRSR